MAVPDPTPTDNGSIKIKDQPPDYKVMAAGYPRPTSPKFNTRSSFSSIRENDSDLAQTFTSSKISSYSQIQSQEQAINDSPAIGDLPVMGTLLQSEFVAPLTQPASRLHGNWSPADTFKGWKEINVGGKPASKSFSDLQALALAWTSNTLASSRQQPQNTPEQRLTGQSPIEKLPLELLSAIIGLLVLDVPPNGITRRNIDLVNLLLTSRIVHTATLNTLYQQITIPHSKIFKKFLAHVITHPALGTIARRLDFSHFNPSALFSTASERAQAQNLTSETLYQCLELTPYIQEFLGQEHIDDDLDETVLRKLFFGLDRIKALDFCGCSSAIFKNAFTSTFSSPLSADLSLERLSLHKCLTLPAAVFEVLLPKLPRLTHLDVAGTRVTDAALASIPTTAQITHLNLAKCNNLSTEAVIEFISTHPAVVDSLVWLSLATDARTHELLDAESVTTLLPLLPRSLKSLSLKGSKMDKSHIRLLLPLTKHLEELAIGQSLNVKDINGLFVPDEDEDNDMQVDWVPHTLKYIDISDMWSHELDIPTLYSSGCALLTKHTCPLEVVEVSEDVGKRIARSPATLTRMGWRIKEAGSRTWIVRTKNKLREISGIVDDGRRPWKMGAENWGMRKTPVARAEVGGMYGSYMFTRKL